MNSITDEVFITLPSIMNFEIGARIGYHDRKGTVTMIDGPNIKVKMDEGDDHIVFYQNLIVYSIPIIGQKKAKCRWTKEDLNYIWHNRDLSDYDLALSLGRSQKAVTIQRCYLREQYHAK